MALAAPLIEGQHLSYAWYLDRLRVMPTDVSLTGDDGQQYLPAVAETVLMSLQAVREADRTGVCTRIMVMMAVLSAAGVRRELLHVAGRAGVLAGGGRRVTVGFVDGALEWLGGQSLLTFSLDGQTIILHRLVARAIRNEMAGSGMLAAMCEAAASVLELYSRALTRSQDRRPRSQDRRAVRGLPQQVMALVESMAGPEAEADEELAMVLLRLRYIAFYHVLERGDSTPLAIAVGEPLTADLGGLFGPEHPDTLNSRNSLAAAYLAAGRVADAIELFEQTLAIRQRTLGSDHSETLNSQNNLASAYQDAGRVTDAIRLYQLNLQIRERLLGARHPSTLNSRGNLAAAYQAADRVADAIPLLEQTLDGRQRVLGLDHPDTRTSRENLAKAYRAVGRVAEAAPLAEQTRAARRGQPPAGAAGGALPAGFRRPPAGPARRVLPAGFRRPPADLASQPHPDGTERSAAKPTSHSSTSRTQDPAPKGGEYDCQIVTLIAAGNPAGIAMAYDRYAAALYGYCQWMLSDLADAAAALQDTFVIAVATLSDLPEPATLRPWLFARARSECRRRILTTSQIRDEEEDSPASQRSDAGQPPDTADWLIDATMPIRVVSQPADATLTFSRIGGPAEAAPWSDDATLTFARIGGPAEAAPWSDDATMTFARIGGPAETAHGLAHADGDAGQAELRTLISAMLAALAPGERDVVELSFRHELSDNDLAIALGVSWSRAHALAARAHGRLEESLAALQVVMTRREVCPALKEMLADWDGRPTEQTRELISWHIEVCQACAHYGRGVLRSAAFSRLLPLAPLPADLRERVLTRCSSTAEDAAAYRRRVVSRRAEPTWLARFARTITQVRWATIRAHPGAVLATVVVAVWVVAAVAGLGLTFAGSHALLARPSVRTSLGSPAAATTAAAVPTTGAAAPTTATARPTPTFSHSAYVPPPVQPEPTPALHPSNPPSPAPSKSSTPTASKSPSPSPATPSSPSPSLSPSVTP